MAAQGWVLLLIILVFVLGSDGAPVGFDDQ